MEHLSQEVSLTLFPKKQDDVPTPPSLPAQSPVVVSGSIQFDMPSRISGRTYRIFVFKPAAPPPPSGYPVVVLEDEDHLTALPASISRALAFALRP
jgi:hypothetical protein